MDNMYKKSLLLRMIAVSLFCSSIYTAGLSAADDTAKKAKPAAGKDKDAKESSDTKKKSKGRPTGADAQMEYNAQDSLKKGIEYLESKQDDRGIKLLTGIAQQYPNSKAAIKADIVLGDYYIGKKQYDAALKRMIKASAAEDPEIQAEAFYKLGICYYNLNDYNQAFMALRQVVNRFPGSVYANESFYYIGLCHFRLNRWTQAVEALEKVGTSVPMGKERESSPVAEAGQRLFVKVYDEDLAVLYANEGGKGLKVDFTNANGDLEEVVLEPLGKEGAYFIGSIPTALAEPKQKDGVMQFKGGDEVSVTYIDTHTSEGQQNKKVIAKVGLVSTATAGFTNGDFKDYTYGIFADQDFFMRVRDLDLDTTPGRDTVKVKVTSQYRPKKEDSLDRGVDFNDDQPLKIRDTKEYTLTETAPRSGVFVGTGKTKLVDSESELIDESELKGPALIVEKDDIVVLEYIDEKHIAGSEPVERIGKANILTGKMADVVVEHRQVDDAELRAKKNLIEAKIFLQLGTIFKEVGLIDYANAKAQEGIDRIDDLMKINKGAALERSVLEDAFNTKWELLIVQNKIQEAISVCSTLIKMFPDSSLVDRALMKIAEVKINDGAVKARQEGMNIYRGIIQLPKSELKPEAQFRIAEVMEKTAIEETKEKQKKDPTYRPNYSSVMLEYKKCADNYPDSPFAGMALEKIADYYLEAEDFQRVMEMMEQVFRDYPDADFLDRMCLKWATAAFKLGKYELSKEKCEQLLSEYPNSVSARKTELIKKLIDKKLGGGE